MKRFIIIISVLLIYGINIKIYSQFSTKEVSKYYRNGEYDKTIELLKKKLNLKDTLAQDKLINIYTYLGNSYKKIGKKDSAEFYLKSSLNLSFIINDSEKIIYSLNNLAILFKDYGNYAKAISFYKKALSLLEKRNLNKRDYYYLYSINYNLATTHIYLKNYHLALIYLDKSNSYNILAEINKRNKIYYNKARCNHYLLDTLQAYKYYKYSIEEQIKLTGKSNLKVALKKIEFGRFLTQFSFNEPPTNYFYEGLNIYKQSLKLKNSNLFYAYYYLSFYYKKTENIDSTKYYIQQSIISLIPEYYDLCFYSNPLRSYRPSSKLEYLNALKAKTELLQLLANRATDTKEKQKNLDFGIETLNLALDVFNNIREGFLTEENKLFITENEKELYSLAIEMSMQLYDLTGRPAYKDMALYYSCSCKASLLQTERLMNDALYAQNAADSTGRELFTIKTEIAAYENLLNDEKIEKEQNKEKINLYQDKLFDLKRREEVLLTKLNKNILTQQTDSINAQLLQMQLEDDETLIDYHIATNAKTGKKTLYANVLSKNNFQVISQDLDTMFDKHLSYIKNRMIHKKGDAYSFDEYTQFTTALHYLYTKLIQPAEQYISGNKLILIPDEELSFLSFDILLTTNKGEQRINYANLPYLLKKYALSYLLSAEMMAHQNQNIATPQVYAFAPEYKEGPVSKTRFRFGVLNNLETEIKGLLGWFSGEKFCNEYATEQNFKSCSKKHAVFHFALHADYDVDSPKFSYLAFNQDATSDTEDGLLYNYEIGLMDLHSPLVVLSGCNTGIGKQVSGEGIMSLARGFFKAGVQSVVHTLWSINDASSSKIMTDFYRHLAQGHSKSKALQLAKLDYLQSTSNTYTDPSYWSGYAICGSNAPILHNNYTVWYVSGFGALFIGIILFLIKINKQLKFTPLHTQSLSTVKKKWFIR